MIKITTLDTTLLSEIEGDYYYCINNGFATNINLVCGNIYFLTFIGDYINIRYKDKRIGGWQICGYQNFEDYFMPLAEWREQQMKSILDD